MLSGELRASYKWRKDNTNFTVELYELKYMYVCMHNSSGDSSSESHEALPGGIKKNVAGQQ